MPKLKVVPHQLELEVISQPRESKRQRIIDCFRKEGEHDLVRIAGLVGARPSYVAQVLQGEGLIHGYFDLYSHVGSVRNIYGPAFRGVLSFKSLETTRRSVARIDELYRHFERLRDRAGQHQAMIVALTGLNRARWCGKIAEAEIFRQWIERVLRPEEAQRRSA